VRPIFVVATGLALFLGVLVGALRNDARYYTRSALVDLSAGRAPGDYLASGIDKIDLSPALMWYAAPPAGKDPVPALAVAEMEAAGVLSSEADPVAVSVRFQELLKQYPASPLVHYRYAAYLLSRVQVNEREMRGLAPGGRRAQAIRASRAELVAEARRRLQAAGAIDPENSLIYYEMAYSHLALGDANAAFKWFARGAAASEFDAGDDVVLGAAARLVTEAKVPPLEARVAVYRVAESAPSFLAGRMETLAASLLSDAVIGDRARDRDAYVNYMAPFEDLSDKLFQTAAVLRQSQASLVTAGVTWRRISKDAALHADASLSGAARDALVRANYRYLLVGWRRQAAGFPAQQGIVELDAPFDLRLPFSRTAQAAARYILVAACVFLFPAIVVGVISMRVRALRQPALSLAVLLAFSILAYSACFLSVASERAGVSRSLDRRIELLRKLPDFLRREGQPGTPAEFRTDIPKDMLYSVGYTASAGKVLAYVGTRDCLETLVNALSDPRIAAPGEVAAVLKEATGADFGYNAKAPKAEREKAVEAWRQWWQQHRDQFPEAAPPRAKTASKGGGDNRG